MKVVLVFFATSSQRFPPEFVEVFYRTNCRKIHLCRMQSILTGEAKHSRFFSQSFLSAKLEENLGQTETLTQTRRKR